jgi:hypothetical protein
MEFFGRSSFVGKSMHDPCVDLIAALVSISGIANDLARTQMTLLTQDELRTALSNQSSVGSALSSLFVRLNTCHFCKKEGEGEGERMLDKGKEPSWSSKSSIGEDMMEDSKQPGAICQEMLVQQFQVSAMVRCTRSDDHFAQIKDFSAQIFSRILSINARAISMMGKAKYSSVSTEQANRSGILPIQDENNTTRDFLGRSIAHQMLDEMSNQDFVYGWLRTFRFFQIDLHQVQDQLGRTLLHLLCQKGSWKNVEQILELGADPSATTIYGHLPLHYAARRGDFYTCEALLEHKERFDIGQADRFGFSAYDHAVRSGGHERVEWLLKDAAEQQRTSRACRTLSEE